MRVFAALAVPAIFLAACSALPPPSPSVSAAAADCERATVPPGAVFGVRHGVDTATYPPKMQRGHSGCQRVWYGDRAHPEAMQVLATYYFEAGHVRRLVGRVPGGASYDCEYHDGVLDTRRSQNAQQCPKASELE